MKTDNTHDGVVVYDLSGVGSCVTLSIQAPYKVEDNRYHNEDSYLICEPYQGCTVMAIADGAGGYQGR